MIFNLVVMCIICLFGFMLISLPDKNHDNFKIRKFYVIIVSIILILQSGLRNVAVGADTYAYFVYFEQTKNKSWSEIWQVQNEYIINAIGKDPGYVLFQKIVQLIITDYHIFLFLIAILFFASFGNFLLKNTERINELIIAYLLYSALFYAFYSITGHRQTIATAGAFWAYEYLKKRKLLPFLIIILLSSLIHKSCLIFFPFYFLANFINPRVAMVIGLSVTPFFVAVKDQLALILAIVAGYDYYGVEETATYTFTLMLVAIAALALITMKQNLKRSNLKFAYIGFSLAISLTPLTWVNGAMMRVVQYYAFFLLLLVPSSLNALKIISRKLGKVAYMLIIISLFSLYMKNSWKHEYRFLWQEMALGDHYKEFLKSPFSKY